jgi:hypothetical protein
MDFAGSLNFKDVMLAYGKLPRDAMGSAGKLFSIGLEFAGTVCSPCSLWIDSGVQVVCPNQMSGLVAKNIMYNVA